MIDIKRLRKDNELTQKQLAELLGIHQTGISRIENGEQELTMSQYRKLKQKYALDAYEVKNISTIQEAKTNYRSIPFVDGDFFATISPVMQDAVALKPDTFVNIPMFSTGEFAITVTGHSMKGYINHGDWVVIRRLWDIDRINYGEPYLVITRTNQLKTIKFVKPSKEGEDKLVLIPYNIEQFDPQDIEKEDVLEMYQVIGLFRKIS